MEEKSVPKQGPPLGQMLRRSCAPGIQSAEFFYSPRRTPDKGRAFGLFSLKQPGAISLNVKVLPDEQMPVTGAELVDVDPLRIRHPS